MVLLITAYNNHTNMGAQTKENILCELFIRVLFVDVQIQLMMIGSFSIYLQCLYLNTCVLVFAIHAFFHASLNRAIYTHMCVNYSLFSVRQQSLTNSFMLTTSCGTCLQIIMHNLASRNSMQFAASSGAHFVQPALCTHTRTCTL